jgi:endonuclease-3
MVPRRARAILRILKRLYPDARIALDFGTPFQLYVATVLSAQCTDVRVNQVTPALFARFPDPATMARARRSQIEKLIRSTGFFRNKSKNIQAAAQKIVADHDGRLPDTMEELLTLPGVGRKTANVILGNSFDTPGITVDTHVGRLARRLGLTAEEDPVKVEFALMALIPRRDWTQFSHMLIFHGRQVCKARKPLCADCGLAKHCPSRQVD